MNPTTNTMVESGRWQDGKEAWTMEYGTIPKPSGFFTTCQAVIVVSSPTTHHVLLYTPHRIAVE